ncbi:Mitochondrial inner membrane protein [Toxocara canis]|uniref:MICOS complex subunit MIC60 n=1 Tax=Toxocara canis TaxID=6265 RepID=A0A0B2VXG5_TOXCA|nr:Mitochondrial inner membrane protein [Toxocara canis]
MFTPAAKNIAKPRLFAVAKPLCFVRRISSSTSKGGGGTKKLLIGTTVFLAGAGGALAYGCYNTEFRNRVEEMMPWTKCCFERTEHLLCKFKSKCPKRAPVVNVDKKDLDASFVAKKNKELEAALIAAIEIAESKVRTAKDSKLKTITGIREHAALLKKAVDDRENGDWSGVSKALDKAETFAKSDRKDEVEARNSLDALKEIAFNGKNCSYTSGNKLIVLAMETAKKLNQQIDELNLLAEAARTRSRLLTQYKALVDESRKRFAKQLHELSQHIDMQDNKTVANEAKAAIDHARAEVDSLYRQLIEQQLEAEQKIAEAVEAQRLTSSKLAEQELKSEQDRIRRSDADHNAEIAASRAEWENELKERLARAAAAHEEHMQQVLLMQKQISDAEMAAKA